MAAILRRHLARAARRGFVWGEHDCMLFAADWALACTGRDPALALRGRYAGEGEAMALLERAGGAAPFMHRALIAAGWYAVKPEAVASGDIVLASLPGHSDPEAAGICLTARRIALLTRRGLVVAPVPVEKAWRHTEGRHG